MLQVIDGTVQLKDQLRDYTYRGEGLDHMSFMDFILNTYEGQKAENQPVMTEEGGDGDDPRETRGRPANGRVAYMPEARKGDRCRIIRMTGHETLPRFVGKWFPRNDSDDRQEQDFYHAQMLLLLRPWREMSNLMGQQQNFQEAFENLLITTSKRERNIIHNIQYYYECSDGAKARREEEKYQNNAPLAFELEVDEEDLVILEDEGYTRNINDINEDDIERARHLRTHQRETRFGDNAITEAFDAGIFKDWPVTEAWKTGAHLLQEEDWAKIKSWEKQLKETTRKMVQEGLTLQSIEPGDAIEPVIIETERDPPEETEPRIEGIYEGEEEASLETIARRPKLAMLNTEQRLAHNMVEDKLKDMLTGRISINPLV